jgi:lactoylglutathione lyase
MELAHVAICVSDIERAMEFYREFGFEETHRFTLNGVENVYLGRPGTDGDLQLRYDPDRTTPIAPSRADHDHIAFIVEDVEETFRTAIDAGGAAVLEPTEIEPAGAYAAFVEDPEGYTLEFYRGI